MKKTKLLIPALTIAGACTVVAPIVTSCGGKESTEAQGVQVTSTEFYSALSYFIDDTNHSNNYSVTAIQGTVSTNMVVNADKEYAKTSNNEEGKYKWGTVNAAENGYLLYTSGAWVSASSVPGFDMNYIPSYACMQNATRVKSALDTVGFNNLEFENGIYYITETSGSTTSVFAVTFADFNGTKRIKRLSIAINTDVKLIATFSNYGTSVLPEGFPE